MPVLKRTFEAKLHPKDSPERARLNLSSLTSEYMPSYRYVVCDANGKPMPFSYRTKTEAEERAAELRV